MRDTGEPVRRGESRAPGTALLRSALRAYRMDPGLALHRAAEAHLLQSFPVVPPVLEIGCHDGTFAALALADRVNPQDVVGSDRDVAALVRARDLGHYGMVVGLDATQLPFRRGTFSTVLCNSVLTHVMDLGRSLAEIERVLADGGRLLASVPTPLFHRHFAPSWTLRQLRLASLARHVDEKYDREWSQRHFLTREDWANCIAAAGLSLETWKEYLGAPHGQIWSGLFCVVRMGFGRITLGALLRRIAPAGSRCAAAVDGAFVRMLRHSLGESDHGTSAYFVARKTP